MNASVYSASFAVLKSALAFPSPPLRLRHAPSSLPVRSFQTCPSSPTLLGPPRSSTLATAQPLQQEEASDEEEDLTETVRPSVEPFHDVAAAREIRSFPSPELEVRELEELPEQWRRSKIAWLCKELPSYKHSTFVRILNAQRQWITQDDATYVAVHCMRIRENEASFRVSGCVHLQLAHDMFDCMPKSNKSLVWTLCTLLLSSRIDSVDGCFQVYKWMSQQHWFHFDFALATKLADYLGKDRKFAKCREIFDAIINQGRVPSESTFHILTVAYLSAPVEGCLDEACSVYNKMIQLGGYRPRLSLHNSLFRALVSRADGRAKYYLKQAEFIFHNIVTSEFEVHQDVYAGLIWLHSYQDTIDRERIADLRQEMKNAGFKESTDVLISIMRACSKADNVQETEKTWLKLLESDCGIPPKAFVYLMEVYAKVGEPMKSLEIFEGMKKQNEPVGSAAYLKIIEVMSKAEEIEITETIFDEYIGSGMKPVMPAFLSLMSMYFNLHLHDKLEIAFSQCATRCCPNRSIYNLYLESLVRVGSLEKAEGIFNEMHTNGTIGTNARSCNAILDGYLASGECAKAEKVYDIMRQKKYEIEPHSVERLQEALSLNRKMVKRKVSMKLDEQQREILVGLLLGGVRIESDEERRNHKILFEFSETSNIHSVLRVHIHERFYEWLTLSSRSNDDDNETPYRFSTIAHSYFGFFADQFWLKGRLMTPKLIHRWLSARVLAYWYMYGGLRSSSGDILLRLKGGSREDTERIIRAFQAKSLGCRVKRKGGVFWVGFQGTNADMFWELVEPYILESVKSLLVPDGCLLVNSKPDDFNSESETDEQSPH
ncbi:hypothetical protein BHE74_00044033 [Ensete ventricosum]|nr:hypothetical protein GW17_00049991 [Ensete ventricosum]RWW49757.1 hypothetical protein BHE74_00044033 [Ensete ventricosum]